MTPFLKCLLPLGLAVMIFFKGVAQRDPGKVVFHTSKGLTVKVDTGGIYVNNRLQFKFAERFELILPSKRHQVIESGGIVFLFLEMNGSPNLDRFHVFKVSGNKVELILDALSSDIKDVDGDGYPEFGGRDLTEVHPNEDSMYYIPTEYYEIRNGRLVYDSSLVKDMDVQINGVYLSGPGDAVIIKPGKKKVSKVPLLHPFILSERTDGPANIRDTIKGKVLFSLYDNVPVYTSDTANKWCSIALKVYLRACDFQSRIIPMDTHIYSAYREVGKTTADIHLAPADMTHDGEEFTAVLRGYTSMQNIRQATLPENALCRMMERNSMLTAAALHDLILGYQFTKGQMGEYTTYQLDETFVNGLSNRPRLLLIFHKDVLLGVVHLRKLGRPEQPLALARGYSLYVIGDPSEEVKSDVVNKCNLFIK